MLRRYGKKAARGFKRFKRIDNGHHVEPTFPDERRSQETRQAIIKLKKQSNRMKG